MNAQDSVSSAPAFGGALSPGLRATTHAVAEALFTTHDGPPAEPRLAWLVDELDDFFARAGGRALFVFRLCMAAISVLAPLLIGKLGSFRNLTREDRFRALERMEQSALALVIFGAKTTLCIVYYEHPDAARDMEFDGECLVTSVEVSREPQ